jgi:membrane protein implicated in regulation of membrane protease activity
MLTPQFSLRRLLLIVTVSAVLCLIPAVATRGYLWALGVALALVGAFVLAGFQVLLFAVSRVVGVYVERRQAQAAQMEKT